LISLFIKKIYNCKKQWEEQMISLSKTHDPRENGMLLQQISPLNIREALKKTEELWLQKERPSESIPLNEKVQKLFTKKSIILPPTKAEVDSEGYVIPDWKEKLDEEYEMLVNNLLREVNLVDYGAVGDGKTDCTAAFRQALGKGKVRVKIPAGVYVTKGIRIPSWTWLEGEGKRTTVIKLHDEAEKGTRLVTNYNHWKGNHHLYIQGLSLDWNVERLGDAPKTSTWGNHSSCLTFANVTYGWVKDVEGINPGLHCFDISATLYNYSGDGYRARGSSKYVWLENLNGYGFGDDGITTHHSDYIFIGHSHMCDPSGRAHDKGFSNSNGFEIDDGSRNVLLVNNSSARCFGGVEIKAHHNSSAASNVEVVGHMSVKDNRSFNFRHIGHHKKGDIESRTAFNIKVTNCASIAPVYSDLYLDSKPRGMVISAYKNVVINHFTVIGDPKYDFKHNPVIAVQYRARNITLNGISILDFKNAGAGIKVFGGENRADDIMINQAVAKIEVGSGVKNIQIKASTDYF
jgi:hypothetical protein